MNKIQNLKQYTKNGINIKESVIKILFEKT